MCIHWCRIYKDMEKQIEALYVKSKDNANLALCHDHIVNLSLMTSLKLERVYVS